MISFSQLQQDYGHLSGEELLKPVIRKAFPGRIALVSSFGAESAVLCHMVAQVDPETPVLFVDTNKLFAETLAYKEQLVERLGLTNTFTVRPTGEAEAMFDPDGALHQRNPDDCCDFRKTGPLERALRGYQAWITGRKRYHGGQRRALPALEMADWRIKINPLADWGPKDIDAYFRAHDLPRHPLVAQGFLSVGCIPCTTPVADGEDPRAGRWRGADKTECGIHWSYNGRPIHPGGAVVRG